jgi:superfamily II DNA helicase RecQ
MRVGGVPFGLGIDKPTVQLVVHWDAAAHTGVLVA